jgi:hypothetical protein
MADDALTVALATGRYADFHPSQGVAVGITVGRPRFSLRYRIAAEVDELKPFGLVLRKLPLTPEEFDAAYVRRLERVGVARLRERFDEIAAAEGNERLVLLCYEDVLAGQRCHRRTLARWWTERTGEPVPEVEPAQMTLGQEDR